MTHRLIAWTFAVVTAVSSGKERTATERVRAASEVLGEIMEAPDRGIPDWVLERAHCAVIVPGMKKGGFVVGARYGKGVALCRSERGGWTGPATVRTEGGSLGLQIGGGEVDALLFVMNEKGKDKLMKSKFTLGGELAAMAGPVGRTAKAETDLLMHAKILSYSRSRGVFAGAVLEGATLRPDEEANRALYGRAVTPEQILGGKVRPPKVAASLISTLSRRSWREQ